MKALIEQTIADAVAEANAPAERGALARAAGRIRRCAGLTLPEATVGETR